VSVLDRFFDTYYRLQPVNATFTGVHQHDHEFPDWSPEGIEAALDTMRRMRSELGPRLAEPAQPFPDLVDLELADAYLDIQMAELEGRHFQRTNPALFTGEAIFGLLAFMLRDSVSIEQRLAAATARMDRIPRFLTQARRTLEDEAVPAHWLERALRECQGAAILFSDGTDRWLKALSELLPASAPLFERAGRASGQALAAFEDFSCWLKTCHSAAPSTGYSCGPAFFDRLLARGHFCARSRHDLLADARISLEEAEGRLAQIASRLDPGGWQGVQLKLAASHAVAGQYLDAYGQLWRACKEHAAAYALLTWPDLPVRYTPVPECLRGAAPYLYFLPYRSPAAFDRIAVQDYLVTPIDGGMPAAERDRRLSAVNTSVIKLNHVIHHGAVGHHVQNCNAYRSASRIGQVSAIDCASRIGMFCGGTLAEGWACYATDLMDEVGFLSPFEHAAEQHSRVRQLCRAIVDIELHQGTMEFDEAVMFYQSRTGMTEAAAVTEVTKNSMFPCTAIMYWLGTEGIHQLRQERERLDGARFSLMRFHDRLLSFGAIPVPIIARLFAQEVTA
jgi:hypothetical protein